VKFKAVYPVQTPVQERHNPDWSEAFDQDGETGSVRKRDRLTRQQLEYHEHIRRTQKQRNDR